MVHMYSRISLGNTALCRSSPFCVSFGAKSEPPWHAYVQFNRAEAGGAWVSPRAPPLRPHQAHRGCVLTQERSPPSLPFVPAHTSTSCCACAPRTAPLQQPPWESQWPGRQAPPTISYTPTRAKGTSGNGCHKALVATCNSWQERAAVEGRAARLLPLAAWLAHASWKGWRPHHGPFARSP